ncbi:MULTISPECIES: hypothetical protein [Pyrobaculum]|uniref:Uncharacterized protein n=2 Tax=Pyrobaculum arsenaticum TaxID=121277 RepID=A4WLL5_PYRAR|nr:hypothetical protein [Pyrobaculum arsenaticum]ABP51282.1 conserved hypothetical protein [Pyrobaculum arsenaticum DSM 13514]MCY0889491.1 hypothetical protein [Pyrobaculum arsenaticum]NYR16348.1 hypothetical protein [Pyrobaculum arsenaticum]
MKIERTGQPVSQLLQLLEEDLRRDDIIHVERVPSPKPGEKYREIISKFLKEFGISTVYMRVRSPSFERRYVISIKYDWTMGGIVEGWVVEGRVVKVFEPIAVSLSDIERALDHYGDAFWKAEERLLSKKMGEAYTEEKPPAD